MKLSLLSGRKSGMMCTMCIMCSGMLKMGCRRSFLLL